MRIRNFVLAGCLVALAAPASADFVNDEFDGTELGAHWTWDPGVNPEAEPTTSTYAVGNGTLTMTAAKGADFYANGDGGAYVEQDQPVDAEWEIKTKLINYNPTDPAYQHRWNKAGLAISEDFNHWIYVFITSSSDGTVIRSYGQAQFDPTGANGGSQYIDEFQQIGIEYSPEYYLRLRKTVHGYMGEYSYDDVNWIPATPLLRNPQSADGTLNGKIRLVVATGGPQADRTPAPAVFDYIRKTTLTTPTGPYADDEFDGTSSAVWNYSYGDPAGTVTMDGSAMLINPGATSPTGSNDINSGTGTGNESGTVAWQAAPAGEEYSVFTKVDQTVFADASRYRGHGIRIWQNQTNWIGVKILKNAAAPGAPESANLVQAMFTTDDSTTRTNVTSFTSESPTDPAPGYLRVDRSGSMFRVQYSFDGTNWSPALTEDYADGWVALSLQPDQPLLVQLFSYLPNTSSGEGTFVDSSFDFIRYIDRSSVADWQLF